MRVGMVVEDDILRVYFKLDTNDKWYEYARFDARGKRIEEMLGMTEEEFKTKYQCFKPKEREWMRIYLPDFIWYRTVSIHPNEKTIDELLDLYKALVDIIKRLKEIYGR